jgi:hypothetical protein
MSSVLHRSYQMFSAYVGHAQKEYCTLSSKRVAHFQTHKSSRKAYKFGHGSQRRPKPITALAGSSSNIVYEPDPLLTIVSRCEYSGAKWYTITQNLAYNNYETANLKDIYGALTYCKVGCQSVAKQRLGKNFSNRITVFKEVRATTGAMQWFGKYVWTIEAMFSEWSVPRSYLEDNWRYRNQLTDHMWSGNQRITEIE